MSSNMVSHGCLERIIRYLSLEPFGNEWEACVRSECVRALSGEFWDIREADRAGSVQKAQTALVRAMYALNLKAVQVRYPSTAVHDDCYSTAEYTTLVAGPRPTATDCFKAIESWLYQCNESSEIRENKLYVAFESIRDILARFIVRQSTEYQTAMWG